MHILPGCLSPQPEEIFESWFARLAFNHWISPRQLYAYLLSDFKSSSRISNPYKIDFHQLVEPLSQCTLTSHKRIQNTLLVNFSLYQKSIISHNKVAWLLPSVRRSKWSVKSSNMYCPQCLATDGIYPYFRQRWSLSFLIVCSTCNTLLLDRCPKCETPPTYLYISLLRQEKTPLLSTCSRCGFNLATAPIIKATPDCLSNQQELISQLSAIESTDSLNTPTYFFILYQALKVIIFLIRNQKLTLPVSKATLEQLWFTHLSFSQLPILTRAELLNWAIHLLNTGPSHYKIHLTNYYSKKGNTSYKYPKYRMGLYFRELLTELSIEEVLPLIGRDILNSFIK